jgi:endo-1,4-beta-xylanase
MKIAINSHSILLILAACAAFSGVATADLPPLPTGERLKTLGAEHHLLIGAASDLNHNDLNEEAIIKNEYSILSDENCLKPRITEPSQNNFNFSQSDLFVKFCTDNKIVAKGHTLVGRNLYLPKWMLDPNLTTDDLQKILVNHITTLVSRYKKGSSYGEIKYWDVINEVISGPGKSVFEKLGKNSDGDYLYWELIFKTAHAADPDCVLIWNEDNIESNPKKAEKLYETIKRLKAKGIPIDGVGFQCHIGYENRPAPDNDFLTNIFQKFADLGVSVVVSEMDVPQTMDQVNIYKNIVTICTKQPKCIIWDTWNVTDKYSWRKGEKALLFDDNYTAKPTYYAVQSALAGTVATTPPPPSTTPAVVTP